jgi:hypothetical protein
MWNVGLTGIHPEFTLNALLLIVMISREEGINLNAAKKNCFGIGAIPLLQILQNVETSKENTVTVCPLQGHSLKTESHIFVAPTSQSSTEGGISSFPPKTNVEL